MELPQYTLYLSLPRILIPKGLVLLFLGGFFYFGVWLNLLILNIIIPAEYHFYIILGITALVLMQGILNYIKYSNHRYFFYKDRIVFEGKKEEVIMFSDVQNLAFNRSALDMIFNTGEIMLSPVHKMKFIGNTNQVYFYIQSMMQYYQQSGYQMQQPYGYQRTQAYYQTQMR